MLLVLRNGAEKIGGDVGEEQRLLRLQHSPDGMIAVGQDVLEGSARPAFAGSACTTFFRLS